MPQTKEGKKAYMRNYYIKNKAVYHQRYIAWCEANPRKNKSVRDSKKTPEELKAYQHQYYINHKGLYYRSNREWCKNHPKNVAAAQQRWHKRNPAYYRDYIRKRVAITDPLIFQFLDGGFDNNIEGYIEYLHSQKTPEQYIGWFQKDIQKYMGAENAN